MLHAKPDQLNFDRSAQMIEGDARLVPSTNIFVLGIFVCNSDRDLSPCVFHKANGET